MDKILALTHRDDNKYYVNLGVYRKGEFSPMKYREYNDISKASARRVVLIIRNQSDYMHVEIFGHGMQLWGSLS